MLLFSIFDKKASAFGSVMMAPNDGLMCRTIEENVSGSGHTLARFPEDFDLYELGSFDDSTGRLVAADQPRFVCNLAVVLSKKGS